VKILNVLFFSFLFSFFFNSTEAQLVTDNAEVSLLTCSSGDELYSTFGHSAIRVKDTVTERDIVFNYGIFDFDTPHFYWKFVRGKLMYQLAIQQTDRFLMAYSFEGRSVKEEPFNLTQQEKTQLISFLKKNYKPENRYYLYDFFYKNCSSIIWDVVTAQIDDTLHYDSSVYKQKSFRQMLYPSLEELPWAKFGIDIALGTPSDKIASFKEQTYLPAYLSRNLSHTFRDRSPNGNKNLLGKENMLVKKEQEPSPGFTLTPKILFWGMFLVFLMITLFLPQRKTKNTIDYFFFALQGLLGLLLLFLWFGTDHQSMHANLNLLWANPLAILLVFILRKKKNNLKIFTLGMIFLGAMVTLMGWNLLPQHFHPAFIPVCLSIMLRVADHIVLMKGYSSIFGILRQSISKREIT